MECRVAQLAEQQTSFKCKNRAYGRMVKETFITPEMAILLIGDGRLNSYPFECWRFESAHGNNMGKIHEDCPFTKEEMDAIKAELYYINSTNHCFNPPHPSWYRGLNDWQVKQQER